MKFSDIINESQNVKVGQIWKFNLDPTSISGKRTDINFRDEVEITKISGEDIWFSSVKNKKANYGHMMINNFKQNYKYIK